MRKLATLLLCAAFTLPSVAQELPQPSPSATLQQRVGLTDVTVKYSRPSVKDREVFGTLVPYDELWRTGANKATQITFSTPVNFGGEEVAAGTYSLFSIPSQAEWTVILNKETELWGTGNFDEGKNVAVVEVQPMEAETQESFTIDVNELRNETALLTLHWENTKVAVPIKVKTQQKALENIKVAIGEAKDEDKWRVYRNAANYYFNNDIDDKMALDYVNQSIALNRDSWYSHYLQSEILADLGSYDKAVKSASMALEMGQAEAEAKDQEFSYNKMISEAIADYKKKMKK